MRPRWRATNSPQYFRERRGRIRRNAASSAVSGSGEGRDTFRAREVAMGWQCTATHRRRSTRAPCQVRQHVRLSALSWRLRRLCFQPTDCVSEIRESFSRMQIEAATGTCTWCPTQSGEHGTANGRLTFRFDSFQDVPLPPSRRAARSAPRPRPDRRASGLISGDLVKELAFCPSPCLSRRRHKPQQLKLERVCRVRRNTRKAC